MLQQDQQEEVDVYQIAQEIAGITESQETHEFFSYSTIYVQITDTDIDDDKIVLYTIKGSDRNGNFEIQQRYKNFGLLRSVLSERWPGCYIPPLPPKQKLGNLEKGFIEQRRCQLQVFLNDLSCIPYLWYSEECQIFLRVQDLEERYSKLQKQGHQQILKKYKVAFQHVNQFALSLKVSLNENTIQEINNFQHFVKQIGSLVHSLKETCANMIQLVDRYNDQYLNLITTVLPQITQQVNIFEGHEALIEKLKEHMNSNNLHHLEERFRLAQKELDVFQETLKQRDSFLTQKQQAEQKLEHLQEDIQDATSGRRTIKTLFKQNKEEYIAHTQSKIDQQVQEIKNLSLLHEKILTVLGQVEIPRFKKCQQDKIQQIVKQLALQEKDKSDIINQFWTIVYHKL